jgi:hypothetical protein
VHILIVNRGLEANGEMLRILQKIHPLDR